MDVISYLLKLVILALPLFAIPAMLKSSNSMLGKIYGTAQNLGNKFTGGMKEDLGKRGQLARMETSARRSVSGLDADGNLIADNRRNRFRRYVGGRATRSQARMQNKEAEAKRLLEDDVMRDMNNNPDGYAGVGADRGAGVRVKLGVEKMQLKREIEEMEPAKLKLEAKDLKIKAAMLEYQSQAAYAAGGPGRDDFLRKSFANAETDEQRAALADLAMQNGSSGRDMVSEFASQLAGANPPGSPSAESQALAAHLGKNHYPALESSTPEVTDFINNAGAQAPGTGGSGTYKKVTAETVGNLDVTSLQKGLQTQGAISDQTLLDALSERHRGSLSQQHLAVLENEKSTRGL